jgi:mannose-6-phosphate isomerase-like protein (cupin superfamily)
MKVDRIKVEKDWKARGFSGGLWVDPPGQVWEDYRHDVDELFMLIEGEVELEMQGKKIRPKPGEEILIPANVLHSVRNLGRITSRWLYAYKQ